MGHTVCKVYSRRISSRVWGFGAKPLVQNRKSMLGRISRLLLCISFGALGQGASPALAQSSGSFATVPMTQVAAPAPTPVQPPLAIVTPIAGTKGPSLPVVMFRASPTQLQQVTQSGPAPVVPKPMQQAQAQAHIRAQVTPIAAHKAKRRGPFRRIFEDTRTSVVRDVPEALADALPWVDKGQKAESFEGVLSRVASDLQAASARDPQWALGAQGNIRRLAKQLDTFPAPPPAPMTEPELAVQSAPTRRFRPRPIWPGASGRPEAQVRPVTVITPTGYQHGTQTSGVTAPIRAGDMDEAGDMSDQATPPKASRKGKSRARRYLFSSKAQ
jgi:hypothetical protein